MSSKAQRLKLRWRLGVKKKTQVDRDRFAKHFKNFVHAETQKTVENLLDVENKSAGAHKEDLILLSLTSQRLNT